MYKILIAEDDKEINRLLCDYLTSQGYETLSAANGLEALQKVQAHADLSLVLLDLMLPFHNGDTVLRKVREYSNIPVIVVSAKDGVQSRIDLIRMGADDYITKPFDLDEILVRMEAVLRRYGAIPTAGQTKAPLTFKDLVLDPNNGTVTVNGSQLTLTVKEYAILELMLANPKKLFSKANIFESIWNEPYFSEDNTIKVHMSNLRNKIKKYAPEDEYIETVWGMGYKLKP